MSDRIKKSYRRSRNFYDDVLTRSRWWSRLYMNVFWGGIDDNEIARKVLSYIPDAFVGRLLDVPVGTGVFTVGKYARMTGADIVCVDYSEDMLRQARERFDREGIANAVLRQGDVGALPFDDASFDVVLCMNGLHVFPDKEKAYSEICRVLREGGSLVACLCIEGESRISDWLMKRILSRRGWFTPPFETFGSLKERLGKDYLLEEFHKEGSMVYLKATKKVRTDSSL
ncbi:MAG: class I SAM-dependent methyltransferase [Bacteroidales bacterium]|nr:class I SAM-dependent methyltransferase [Bacteroidales bacterium]